MSDDKKQIKKSLRNPEPPHTANRGSKDGAEYSQHVFDVPVKTVSESSKPGQHSGRNHAPKQKLGGDEFDHASQGPTSTGNVGQSE